MARQTVHPATAPAGPSDPAAAPPEASDRGRKLVLAGLLAALRPSVQVFAATSNPAVAASCTLLWGVTPVLLPLDPAPSLAPSSQLDLQRLLVNRGLVRSGSILVFVNVSKALKRSDANFVNLQRAQ